MRVVIAEDAAVMRDGLAAIAGQLFITPKVVEKHVASIFDKLGLAPSDNDNDNDNRRVLAAIRYMAP